MSKRYDALLQKIYDGHSGLGQELKFVQTVLGFLRRKTRFLSADSHAAKVFKMAKMHVARAKQDAAQAAATKPSPAPAKPAQAETKGAAATDADNDIVMLDDDLNPVTDAAQPGAGATKKKEAWAPGADDGKGSSSGDKTDDKPPLPGNGGTTDKYTWTQTLSELQVNIALPQGIRRAREVRVEITPRGLAVTAVKDGSVVVSGEWHDRILTDGTVWTMDEENGRKVVSLNVLKMNKMNWWNCVLKGDPEIDTQRIQPENSKLSDLDGPTRATVEKMMFDQNQKRMNKPTSDEMRKQEMLQKFMKQHPEMDFSNAKIM